MVYLYLCLSIIAEVIGTAALNASEQFTKPIPIIITIVSYGVTFVFLSLVLKTMSMGTVYGIWGGLGIVPVTLVGYVWFDQKIDLAAAIGLGLIIVGVVIINLFSKTLMRF